MRSEQGMQVLRPVELAQLSQAEFQRFGLLREESRAQFLHNWRDFLDRSSLEWRKLVHDALLESLVKQGIDVKRLNMS